VLAVALLATACADRRGASAEQPAATYPTAADRLVLRISTEGGFVPPQTLLQQMPSFSLYGDGRAITQGPQMEIYPGPALPSLVETPISPKGVRALVRDALDAGLGEDHRYTTVSVSDMPTTTFTLDANGERHTTSVYALGAGGAQLRMSATERSARAALQRLSTEVADLRHALPAGSVGADQPYTPEGLRVFARRYTGQRDPMLREPEIEWPLSTPLASFGTQASTSGIRCGAVTGADLRLVLDAARSANQLTPWTSGGARYSLTFRVLLPDERGC
jgi:hypothetical protein